MIKLIGWFAAGMAVVAVLVWAWGNDRAAPDPAQRIAETDMSVITTMDILGASAERVEAIHMRTTEIRYIREEVRRNVEALRPDAVAVGIMSELELFRRGDSRAGGVDYSGAGVLSDGAGGARRVIRAPIPTRRE